MSDPDESDKKETSEVFPNTDKPEVFDEIISKMEAPAEIKEKIRESLFMAIDRRSPSISAETAKTMTTFLTAESENNKQIALKEIEFRENQAGRDFEMGTRDQRHIHRISMVMILVGVAALAFAGYLVMFGDKDLGKQIFLVALGFIAGLGASKALPS
ncbi:MAG: hypothetical protein ACP5IL_09370 [Syntrophobacteraceae bacterium]